MVTQDDPRAQRCARLVHSPLAFVGAATLVATACGSGGGGAAPTPEPTLEAVSPLPGDNYALVYREGSELRHINTRDSLHERLVRNAEALRLVAAEPSGRRVAVAYQFGDSSRLVTVNTESGDIIEVHRGPAPTTYTAAWDGDGSRLGLGYQSPSGAGGIFVVEGTDVRDIGCSASNRFVAWRSPSQAVVADAANYYTVSLGDCATLARLQKAGKSEVTIAANGRRAAWLADRTVEFANRSRPQNIPQLWIAASDGSGARVIADYRSRPSDPEWAPDAREIAYVVESRRWANTTHLVTYDIPSDAYAYIAKEMPLGVPADFGPCWAPNGERLAHDRVYRRSTGQQAYVTHQIVVRRGETEKVVFDEILSRDYASVMAQKPDRCRWLGDHHLLVAGDQGQHIIDVDDDETFDIPAARKVLAAQVYEGGA